VLHSRSAQLVPPPNRLIDYPRAFFNRFSSAMIRDHSRL